MGSQRGTTSLSKSQTTSAQDAYKTARPVAERIAHSSPSSLIKRRPPKNTGTEDIQQDNNPPNLNS